RFSAASVREWVAGSPPAKATNMPSGKNMDDESLTRLAAIGSTARRKMGVPASPGWLLGSWAGDDATRAGRESMWTRAVDDACPRRKRGPERGMLHCRAFG